MREFQLFQARRQADSRRVTGATADVVVQANVNLAVEERASGQHHGTSAEAQPNLRDGTDNAVAFNDQVFDGLLEQPEIRLIFQTMTDRLLIENAVGLGARRTYGRPFRRIQNAKLDAALVGRRRHGAAQRIDFLNEMALANATNRGVTAHLTERLDIVGKQKGFTAHAGRGERSLSAGMAATHYDHIELGWIKHRNFAACGKLSGFGNCGIIAVLRCIICNHAMFHVEREWKTTILETVPRGTLGRFGGFEEIWRWIAWRLVR